MDEEKEIWKDIDGYEGIYQVSTFGNIKSLERDTIGQFGLRHLKEKILRLFDSHQGYKRVTLNFGEKQKHFFVHRLVAKAFIENTENKPFVNHKNGIRNDNFYGRLEWCTQSENEIHARDILNKKMPCGINAPNVLLAEKDIIEIRTSNLTHRQLAKKYNVGFQNISSIKNRKTWKHL